MSIGPGRYDDLASIVREETGADCVVVMVIGGKRGNGFSVQVTSLDMLAHLPPLLADIAKQIRKDATQ